MRDRLADRRQDADLLLEGELCTTLLIASSASERMLTQDEVDQLLGVCSPSWVPPRSWPTWSAGPR